MFFQLPKRKMSVFLLALFLIFFAISCQETNKSIKILFNKHPYADAIISKLKDFTNDTGIQVEHAVVPEENYFDKITISLNSRSGDPDIFMTGAYQIWEYASSKYIEDLTEYISAVDEATVKYDVADFYPSILGALKWDLKAGHKTGSGSLWAIPMGFEAYNLAYNKKVFAEKGLKPPKTIEELEALTASLKEFGGTGTYPLALRGSRNWATIHPGYMTTFANYGAKDFEIENGRLVSRVNSPEAISMTEMWVKLIKNGCSRDWSNYSWYQASADLGAGKAAMLFDADIAGYFQNAGNSSKESGNIAWVRSPLPAGKTAVNSNLWTWALAMNSASQKKIAAWTFIKYFTSKEYSLWAAINAKVINPARKSVFENPDFQKILESAEGYSQAFKDTIEGTSIQFTPQPHFFETTTEWAATLQDLVGGKYETVKAGMDQLKAKMDKTLANTPAQ